MDEQKNFLDYEGLTLYDQNIKDYIKDIAIYRSRDRQNIIARLTDLPQAVLEQNLEKYGYSIGDYFVGPSNYTYILADYNPFKGTATPYCISENHLGIVVDTHASSKWHTGDASNVGYAGSTLHTYLSGTVLDNIKSDFIELFGGWSEHLIAHSKMFTKKSTDWDWYADQYISALTCTQINAGSEWTLNGFQEGEASKSLELFRKYKWTEIFGGEYPWLRNLSNFSNSNTNVPNYSGGLYACAASDRGYLHGHVDLTTSCPVVGLINFK